MVLQTAFDEKSYAERMNNPLHVSLRCTQKSKQLRQAEKMRIKYSRGGYQRKDSLPAELERSRFFSQMSQCQQTGHWHLHHRFNGKGGNTRQLPGSRGIGDCAFGSVGKEAACNVGDPGSIPGWGRFLGEGNGNPLQYSHWEKPINRGTWWTTVPRVAKCWTRLKRLSTC